MKPKASLKSRNTNFLVIASRPATSLHPASFASAALRASADSFWGMIEPLDWQQNIASKTAPYDHPIYRAAAGRYCSGGGPRRAAPLPRDKTPLRDGNS